MFIVTSSFPFQKYAREQLEWLKKVQKNFGSVELNSIAQATSINMSGVYKVGNLPDGPGVFKVGIVGRVRHTTPL